MVRRQNTRQMLVAATIRLVTQHGPQAATTRAIAKATGITEGAIYRHYASKDELRWHAYAQVVEEMYEEKRHLADSDQPLRSKIREWVELTFSYYDRNPDAFTYVLLLPPPPSDPDRQITTKQGSLFMQIVSRGLENGALRPISPELALSHFTGLMLNVPRLINEGRLEGPAIPYAVEVADSIWRVLGREGKEVE